MVSLVNVLKDLRCPYPVDGAPILIRRCSCGGNAEVLHALAEIEGNAGPVRQILTLQEIDTIVVPFVTLAHAHIGGNHDVSFTIMHTGDVGIAGTALDAGVLFWIEDRVAAIDVLIVVTITGNSVGCPLPPYRSYDNRDNHNFPLQDSVQSLA